MSVKQMLSGVWLISLIMYGSCSSTSQPSSQVIHYDTINFGSFYNIPPDSAFFLSLRDEKQKEITSFQNDSTYKVELFFKSPQEVPVQIVSLNSLVYIEKAKNAKNMYLFKISKIETSLGKSYAKLAIVPPDTTTKYIFRNRFWLDSTHTTYQNATTQIDTLCKLTFKIH